MPTRLNAFEMPKRIIRAEQNATGTFARFVAEPFEIGYARTIGNSLRRVLLSSIEGVAITSIRIQGAAHEFCTLKGVVEDVADIVLNLKKVRLRSFNRKPKWIEIKVRGPRTVTAEDLAADNSIQVMNPTQVIADLDEDGVLDMALEIQTGRGFLPAAEQKEADWEIDRIAIDSVFSPVTRVNFDVENTRVGQRTDYEKLILEIHTDGCVTPDDAVRTASAIMRRHLDVFVEYDDEEIKAETDDQQEEEERDRIERLVNMSVNEIELSVRAANCLNNANITSVGSLIMKTEAEMLKYRNFGKKSLNEIKDKIAELGLHLGYSFDPALLHTPPEE